MTMTTNVLPEKLKNRVWCVIPVFNNAATVGDVARRCRRELDKVLVVDDGSTDADLKTLFAGSDIKLIRHPENRGKGAALRSALAFLAERDAAYMITVDGDGQHYPEDIPKFFPFMEKNDYSMIVGCRDFSVPNVTGVSRRGRALANFWMQVETGLKIADCQSGFRAYPVKYAAQLKFICRHYNFETEVLVRAAWAGLEFHSVNVRTWYAEPGKRISHFRPFPDTFRISCIHAHLTACRLLPIPRRKLVKKPAEKRFELLHPVKFLKYLLKENSSPGGLAAAAALGTFWAVLPIPGFHSVAILYFAVRLRLNKLMAFNIQHLFMPPVTPLLCVELGYWLLHGELLLTANFDTLVRQLPLRILEWWLGSLVAAPVFAVITGTVTYLLAGITAGRLRKK